MENIKEIMPPYSLIRSSRRTLALQINKHGELIVRAPIRMPMSFIEDFINQKKDWIQKHQTRIQNSESRSQKKDYSEKEISEMKQKLLEYIVSRVAELWQGKNLPKYTSIKITKSEHRWGSCSGKNGLCFSYRLAEYLGGNLSSGGTKDLLKEGGYNETRADSSYRQNDKIQFIDAIIIHELAHLREKNHQKPFWNLVYSMMPEYEQIIEKYKNIDSTEGYI